MIARINNLIRNCIGSPAVEFALVAPVMFVLCMSAAELAFQTYVQSVLNGEVQKAGRDGTIENNLNKVDDLDKKVKGQLQNLLPNATFTVIRNNYDSYASMAGEPFTDSKYPDDATGVYDGICNHGESYTDVNSNGSYDKNLAESGEGGADDVADYTVTVKYDRLFPMAGLMGWSKDVTLSASTLLKNQPYAQQNQNTGVKAGTCK